MNEHQGLRWIMTVPSKEVFVFWRASDLDTLTAMDWRFFDRFETDKGNTTIKVVAEGFSDRNVEGWNEKDWPIHMPLTLYDFADRRGRVFVHEFKSRLKPTRFTQPQLSPGLLEELGPINDYLVTYNESTDKYGLRLREIKPEWREHWFMARLKR